MRKQLPGLEIDSLSTTDMQTGLWQDTAWLQGFFMLQGEQEKCSHLTYFDLQLHWAATSILCRSGQERSLQMESSAQDKDLLPQGLGPVRGTWLLRGQNLRSQTRLIWISNDSRRKQDVSEAPMSKQKTNRRAVLSRWWMLPKWQGEWTKLLVELHKCS